MSEISCFLGVVICMYYDDHNAPHFHAKYNGYEVTIEIESGQVIGTFPKRALKALLDWHEIHKEELMINWQLALNDQPLNKIESLEYVMFKHVIDAKYIEDYKIWIIFNDGKQGKTRPYRKD